MNLPEIISKLEAPLRKPLSVFLPPLSVAKVYSKGRKLFLKALINNPPRHNAILPEGSSVRLWDIDFQSGLFNAAGMFKTGGGYLTAARQGAGAFLTGTTTSPALKGNKSLGVKHPFMPYPHSGAASNWMGLPNDGHESVAKIIASTEKIIGCPIGASLALNPREPEEKALSLLAEGLLVYEKAGVDFIEINESCPNVEHAHCEPDENGIDKGLIRRLDFIREKFLKARKGNLPVIVKFSNDTLPEQAPALVRLLSDMDFDGVNFGNTSINYEEHIYNLNPKDLINFDFFVTAFGGGLSGLPLKKYSLELCKAANEEIKKGKLDREFHIIRTGGIDCAADLQAGKEAGVSINQWFTGYFEMFSKHGHLLYKNLFKET